MKASKFTMFITALLFLSWQQIYAQQAIKGKVSDSNQSGLPGVNILLKGTSKGTISDASGNYSINATKGATLVFRSLGYATKEVVVGDQTSIDIVLETSDKTLEEVVVTALGVAKDKKSLGYAVSELKGTEFTQAREVNLGNALSGKIAGVNATSTATGPGGSSRVIIRGNGSLGGNNQPLYVINGVPIDNTNVNSAGMWGGFDTGDGLSSINPDDIESISVLKGGASAALYGSRAGSGVILITTKSGKAQKGLGVDFTSTYTAETPLKISDWQYQYGAGTRGAKPATQQEAIDNGVMSWGAKLDGTSVIQSDGVSRPYVAQKDNIKNFYNVGSTFSNTVAVSGGNQTVNFRFSASNSDAQSVVPNSTFSRKSFNLSTNANLSNKVVFESVMQYNIENGENRTFLSDTPKNPNFAAQMLATSTDIRILAPGVDSRGYESLWNSNVYSQNPYFATTKVKNTDDRNRFMGNFSLRYNLTDNLYVRGRLGTDYNQLKYWSIEPTGIAYSTRGSLSQSTRKIVETNAELLVGFKKDFDQISLNALIGGNKMLRTNEGQGISGGQFNVPFNYFPSNLITSNWNYDYTKLGINSLFASADLGYKNLVFLTLSGRQDWFSTLAKENNSLFYPGASLGFVFSDAMAERPSWLTYGKLRTSWAQVGGAYPTPYALNLTYGLQSNPYNGMPLMNIGTNTIPNKALQPNTTTTTEIGVELKTLNNRLGIDLTLYNRVTTNDAVQASTSSASGYQAVLLNVGKVQNQGIEVLLTGTPVKAASGFGWNVSYNFAYNDNKVIKIADGLTALSMDESRTRNGYVYNFEGQPFGMIAGYRAKRDAAGNIVYNKDTGLPMQGEFAALGRGVPPVTMGLTNTFNYKNFQLSFLIDAKFGGMLYSATNAFATRYGLAQRTVANDVRTTGVTVKGVDQNGEAFTKTISAQDYFSGISTTITDEFVYKADFAKLRQLTFGYTFPKSMLGKTPIQSLSLSFVARNLLMLYNSVPNVDPESTYNNGNAQGLEMFGIPTVRSFGLNLMAKF
ncbi:TonB-linked outer membrane protein, SusC/RagA family [Pseudarcicella hirudinis]|uniref:TonB-linked outer membrane protein, SusC/RagA family n=2 Tax=Pseudarcicella hirudinis TaxID=1079859 RepID=A0A1I5TEG7_9BACT|nr:SusC/RagA family TonB-linked outer membrane protein [Pseudarcicella hirudinis]SFP81420.1 TonB-linked outer membrane protein, SusC/RagA family [Pseudarcicella hirudinis]